MVKAGSIYRVTFMEGGDPNAEYDDFGEQVYAGNARAPQVNYARMTLNVLATSIGEAERIARLGAAKDHPITTITRYGQALWEVEGE